MRRKTLRMLAERAELHAEALPGVPLVEISGDDRVLIENHICVAGYREGQILVRFSYGMLQICGTGMTLACAKREQLVIHGKIDSITLLRGD